jgi:hypothetical protein
MKLMRYPFLIFVILIVSFLVYSFQTYESSKAAAEDAGANLIRCRDLLQQIQSLKAGPIQASLDVQSQKELSSLLQQSAQIAKIPETSVASIRPESTHRIGKTSYIEQPTHVELRQISLGQLVTFLQEVTIRDPRVLPTSLRLSVPRAQPTAPSDQWQAEIILTHLVFSPESAGL